MAQNTAGGQTNRTALQPDPGQQWYAQNAVPHREAVLAKGLRLTVPELKDFKKILKQEAADRGVPDFRGAETCEKEKHITEVMSAVVPKYESRYSERSPLDLTGIPARRRTFETGLELPARHWCKVRSRPVTGSRPDGCRDAVSGLPTPSDRPLQLRLRAMGLLVTSRLAG